jgi:beta-lactamase regulating signal transducer with metallopeptidase domain
MHSFSPSFAIVLDTMLKDTVLKSTVLLALACSAAFIMRKRSAATQHMVRTFALSAVLLLPFFVLFVPAWHVKGLPAFPRFSTTSPQPEAAHLDAQALSQATVATPANVTAMPALAKSSAPRSKSSVHASANRKNDLAKSATTGNTTLPSVTAVELVPQISGGFTAQTAITTPQSSNLRAHLPQLLIGMWIIGALFFLARWRMSAMRLSALVRRAGVLTDSGWNAQVRALSGDLGISRHVALLVSDEIEVPITAGILFPRIILSPDYPEWSATRRSAILNHELAHIKRLDALTQSLGHLATTLYWFHPLVWVMVQAMRTERERACDDYVLATGTKASDYAHELLDIVSGLRGPELAVALAMARRSKLEGRVLAVLNPALPRGSVSRKTALALAALTLCIVLPLSAMRAAPQASAPVAKASKKKPSPASAPQPAAHPASAAAPVPYSESDSFAPTEPAMEVEPAEEMEAPEAPEAPEVAEPALAPEAPEAPESVEAFQAAPAVPAIPPVPRVPAVAPVPGVPGVPSVPAVPAIPAAAWGDLSVCGKGVNNHHVSMESHNDYSRWDVSWSGSNCNVDLRAEGDVKFNASATDVQSIAAGGFFTVESRQNNTLKQVKITSSNNGLQYVYKVNDKQQPFDEEAHKWFAQFLLDLERVSGFAANTRIPALLAQGGPVALLDEISNLQSDYVRGIYFQKLLEQPKLPAPIVQRIIQQAGQQLGGGYELARILMAVSKQYDLPDETSRTAFLAADEKLKGDYERSSVLIEFLRRANLSKGDVNMALNSAGGIKGDYEKSRVVLSSLDQKTLGPSEIDLYLKIVSSIRGDYEKSRTLINLAHAYPLDGVLHDHYLKTAESIHGDYERNRALAAVQKSAAQ